MSKRITEEEFPILKEILPEVGKTFESFNEEIIEKYGKHGVEYFHKRMRESLKNGEEAFYSDLDMIFTEIENSEKTKAMKDFLQLQEDIENDELLQDTIALKKEKEILEKEKEKYEKDPAQKTMGKYEKEIGDLKRNIYFLEKEIEHNELIINSRTDNYYEFKRALAEARASGNKKEEEPQIKKKRFHKI
jgi:predicted nucleotidyltransferase